MRILITGGAGFIGSHLAEVFFFQAEDGIRVVAVTGVQTCALPISPAGESLLSFSRAPRPAKGATQTRSEEHTSELQSRLHLVCRLLLEKKKGHRPGSRSRSDRAQRRRMLSALPLYTPDRDVVAPRT